MTRILLTGASGLLGTALKSSFAADAYSVFCLVRNESKAQDGDIFWNPESGILDTEAVSGFDVVINLSGESIGEGRWTNAKKAAILDSRLKSTNLLATALANTAKPPKRFISMSASGYYGDGGDGWLNEGATQGDGFLARVAASWEEAAQPARDASIAVVHPRFGPILSTRGGMLKKLLGPFKLGMGGPAGPGNQFISWISIEDAVGVLKHLVNHEGNVAGTVNTAAPSPVTNAEFAKTLGKVLHRPAVVPLPAAAARLVLGREMADELLLKSQRMAVDRLVSLGYEFSHPELESALKYLIATGS